MEPAPDEPVPTNRLIPPARPPEEEPVCKISFPVLPLWDVPLVTYTEPDTPTDSAFTDVTVIVPDPAEALVPDSNDTDPPRPADVVRPADSTTPPPTPLAAPPTNTLTPPPDPAVAGPVCNNTYPVLPL